MGPRPVPARLWWLIRVALHQHPSPNCGPRRDALTPRFVVLHYTAMGSAQAAIERLSDPACEVSAHYVICKTGAITQLVGEGARAWHAGAGEWRGLDDMNSRSIGIELDNDGQGPFPEALMHSLETLLKPMLRAWDIPPDHVIGHSDMAPGRKLDPGPWFDWDRLARQRLAAPTPRSREVRAPDWDQFRAQAKSLGYTADALDMDLLNAVRLRHRPQGSGPLCAEDMAISHSF
ncbi:N-acetylmuramoyl-L-alanine amidase [uncultured Tateyamaria sp.]|uniref:N-acetylmuramoyl-L-alanine amidase n=1 Tax=uncultured Tateyamaria sp. TaxID=455651 RepID=UPI002605D484|nr:N-acetylmuramoyl-L-alanine amidase [uncultured Tateyamaria sp.]